MANLGEPLRLAGQLERARLVVGERGGDELRQADGVELAARDSTRQRFTRAGQHRYAHEQRIVGGGASVVGCGVEKQIRVHVAGQMLGQSYPRRKHQPPGVDPSGGGFAAQVGACAAGSRSEPEHAAGHPREQPHPDLEHRRQNLVAVVETAEHQPLLGQAAGRARGGERSHGPLRIARAVAVG